MAAGIGGDPIDFAGGQIGNFAWSAAEAVTFLSFLAGEFERELIFFAESFELNDDIVAAGQCLAEAFGFKRDFVIIFCEATSENGFVAAVHGCAAKTHFFCQGGEWGGSGISGEIKNDIEMAENIFNEAERFSFG